MYWLSKTQEETANFFTSWSCMEAEMKLNRSAQTGHSEKQMMHSGVRLFLFFLSTTALSTIKVAH